MIRQLARLMACAAVLYFYDFSPTRGADVDKQALARGAQGLFKSYCHKCHGEGGRSDGGFNVVVDLKKLVDTKTVLQGNARKSKLFRRLVSEENPMPPEFDETDTAKIPKPLPRPSVNEIEVVRQWIDAGAPDLAVAKNAKPRPFLAEADILQAIADDLKTIDARHRDSACYFTLTHLYNAGLNSDELLTYRYGLSKLVNSLSWGRRIAVPKPIDASETVFRIDLRDFRWDERTWQAILAQYPYGLTLKSEQAKEINSATKCEHPYVRADWFVFAASKPPLYHDVLQIPKTDRELEATLQIDVPENIRQDLVARAGFNGSGVSLENNRMIERHESNLTNGAYWKSYDFAVSTGLKNLFTHPLGPGKETLSFEHDGGEIIFNLPNGLQAYMLVKASGERLDVAPTAIVVDPSRPRGEVVNGISCMHCHYKGMIEKDDQIGPQFEKNAAAYPAEVAASVKALYVSKATLDDFYKEDSDRFAEAIKKTGAALSKSEPVFTLARQFEKELDLRLAASEAGLTVENFEKLILVAPVLTQSLGVLSIPGGTVKRDVFVEAFPAIARFGDLGDPINKRTAVSANFEGSRAGDERIDNSLKMKMCWCPPGKFMMGSPTGEPGRAVDEEPVQVIHNRGFWIGKYELTQSQWTQVMGTTIEDQKTTVILPAEGKGPEFPMSCVNHSDAVEFTRKLTHLEHKAGRLPADCEYRLPTEAQWEYACRADTKTATAFGDSLSSIDANFDGRTSDNYAKTGPYLGRPARVGSYRANPWGIHDMHGNVREWCRDSYYNKLLGGNDPDQEKEPVIYRINRGGSWDGFRDLCRSANRGTSIPDFRGGVFGLRLVAVQIVR